MTNFLSEATQLQQRMLSWRRELHQNAEIGTVLPKTAAFVESVLDETGIEHCRLTDSGVAAWIGQGNRCILLRADMDALPGTERSGLSFACKTGAVHACGHDIHTSMLLGAAVLLHEHRSELPGRVAFMFQPGEECMQGAKEMVEAGILDKFQPQCALAMHVNVNDAPDGHVWIKRNTFMASSDTFEVLVEGKRGHGAHPHNAVNPIYAAIQIIQAFTDATRFEVSPMMPNILTVCAVQAGDAANIIPESCLFRGSLRVLDTDVRSQLLERLPAIAAQVGQAYRCSASFRLLASTLPTSNDPVLSEWVRQRLENLLGPERVKSPVMPSMGSEDFSQISCRVPSCYMSIGIHRAAGCTAPLHNEHIVFDEKNVYLGAAIFATLATDYLSDTCLPDQLAVSDKEQEERS